MKNLSIGQIVEFRKKTDRAKKTFVERLSQPIEEKKIEDGGGDYWVRSMSAINRAYLTSDNQFIKNKIDDITADLLKSTVNTTKLMYERNLQILHNFEDIDFKDFIPVSNFTFLEKEAKKANFDINNLPIKIKFNQLYVFENNKIKYIGGILFVAKLRGYTKTELGVFCEAFFRYLRQKYSKDYIISVENIKVVDVITLEEVTYEMLENGSVPKQLENTINLIINMKNQ